MPQKMSQKVQKKSKTVVKKPAAKSVVKPKSKAKAAAPKKAVKKTAPKAIVKKPVVKAVAKAVKQKAVVKSVQVAKKPVAQVQPAAKPVAVKAPANKAAANTKAHYKVGVHVVYPTHGVGKIVAEETQMIGEIELRMLVISFDKDKMTLRVPVHRATAAGLRPVSSLEQMKKVFVTLKSRARTSRGMWSRRAQEYEAKINSGNIFSVAEVVRDLHQNVDQSERSYSERMIYESALARLVGELAAAEGTDHKVATDKLMKLLRGKVAEAAAAAALAKEAA